MQVPFLLNPRTRPCPVQSFSFSFHAGLGYQQSLLQGRAFKWGFQQSLLHEIRAFKWGFQQSLLHERAFKWSQGGAHLWPRMPLHHEVVALRGGMRRAAAAPAPAPAPGEWNGDTNTVQYELPAINCHFSVKCHPEYECIRDECDVWTLSLFDPPLRSQDPRQALYMKGHYSLLTCLIYPSTPSRRRLVLLTKLTNWFFILDDMLEHADMHTAMELFNGLESVLTSSFDKSSLLELKKITWSPFPASSAHWNDNTPPLHRMGCVTAFLERFRSEVWDEMCGDMTPSFEFRVAAAILSSVNGMRVHVRMRQKRMQQLEVEECGAGSTKPTFDELMEVRLHDSYAKAFLSELMEYVLEIDLQDILKSKHDEVADLHVKVEKLNLAAAKHSTWTNDLCSLRKELFKGDRLSIIVLLLAERGIHSIGDCKETGDVNVLQEVINEVWGMIKEQERIAARLLEEIKHAPGSNLPGHSQLVMYSEEMCRCIAGNMYWSSLTGRYNGLHPLPWNTPTLLSISSNFPKEEGASLAL